MKGVAVAGAGGAGGLSGGLVGLIRGLVGDTAKPMAKPRRWVLGIFGPFAYSRFRLGVRLADQLRAPVVGLLHPPDEAMARAGR